MGKQSQKYTSDVILDKKDKPKIHPIWRGVGLFLIVLVPVMGYLGALLILEANRRQMWFRIPTQLLVPGPDSLILVKAIITIIVGAFVYFLLMLMTFIIYRFWGPSQLGPYDVPPVKWKSRK